MTDYGIRALHYVQDEMRHLSSIKLTREGEHALLVFKVMLRQVWHKEYRDGTFVFIEEVP
jgi:hypothetical protein